MLSLKNLSQITHTIGDNVYHFIVDPKSPITEVKEALCSFMKYVGNVEDAVKAQQAMQQTDNAAQPEATAPVAVPPPEPAQTAPVSSEPEIIPIS
jgi:hypothetical protein